MKKIIYTFLGLTILFSSCNEETENHDEVTPTETESEDDVISFNDYIVSQVDQSELLLAKMMDLDEMDIPANEMITNAEEAMIQLDESIQSLEGTKVVGNGGDDFLSAAINHINNVKLVVNIYIDFAEDLSIPDSLWTEEMGSKWVDLAEPIYEEYEISYENLEMTQESFGALNDMDIIPSDVTIEELYEESK